jgi:signal transduction histidine kinase/CheY-like chemotaxis protein
LRQLRDAAVEAGGFDRAGVWLLEGETIHGSWGTDPEGRLRDEHDESYGLDEGPNVKELIRTDAAFVIQPISSEDIAAYKEALPSTHALVALRAGGETVGFVSVDNLLSDRPLREEDLLPLLPFAAQAAIAIRNAQMFEQLKQAQNTLVRSEKMRALGELASGVAHNINNLLTAVLGYSELIQQDSTVSARVSQYARVIERAGLDGAEIVRRVQQFARMDSTNDMAPFDLSTVVQEAIDLTRPAWRNQAQARGCEIDIKTDIERNVRAFGQASEIREVVVNLIKNAADAMPQGGTVTVRCRAEGKEALIEVADTGTGMDEAVRKRIFEPFFTTKGMGLGTGLGLSLAWGTIARHDGRIEVASKPGEGSRFQVRLPVPKTAAPASEPSPAERRASELSGTRLLLVEDEVIVAESVYRSLTARGASVEITESAAEALEWLKKNGASCDVVVSDHGMAGMTGLELLGVVKSEYPAIRRILLSGWGANPPGDVDTSSPEMILSKPVRQDVLVHSILTLKSAPQA